MWPGSHSGSQHSITYSRGLIRGDQGSQTECGSPLRPEGLVSNAASFAEKSGSDEDLTSFSIYLCFLKALRVKGFHMVKYFHSEKLRWEQGHYIYKYLAALKYNVFPSICDSSVPSGLFVLPAVSFLFIHSLLLFAYKYFNCTQFLCYSNYERKWQNKPQILAPSFYLQFLMLLPSFSIIQKTSIQYF